MKKAICLIISVFILVCALLTGCGKEEDTYVQNTSAEQAERITDQAYSEATLPNSENTSSASSSTLSTTADLTETATFARTTFSVPENTGTTISVTTRGKKKSGFFKKKTTTEPTTFTVPTEAEAHGEDFFNDIMTD